MKHDVDLVRNHEPLHIDMVLSFLSVFFIYNKVYRRTFPEAYRALKQHPLNRDSTPFFGALEQSTLFVRFLSHF